MHPRAALRELLSELDARGLHATPRAVAVALWTHADPCGRCWPSQRTLARLIGRCERTVRDAVKALERAGVFLRDVPDLRERRRRRRTTAYRFTIGSWRSPVERPPTVTPAPSSGARLEPLDAPEAPRAPSGPSTAADGTEARESSTSDAPGDLRRFPAPEYSDDAAPGAEHQAHHEAPAPAVELSGWALVDVELFEGAAAGGGDASPATAALASPATVAARRLPRAKAPPTPAPRASSPPSRAAPRRGPGPVSALLAGVSARLLAAVRDGTG